MEGNTDLVAVLKKGDVGILIGVGKRGAETRKQMEAMSDIMDSRSGAGAIF